MFGGETAPMKERKILHIDMDAFYAAIEQLDNSKLKGKPVIVGGDPAKRGVVSTCSYEARQYGVRSAMPLREAYRRCPHGIFVPVRSSRYEEVSKAIMEILFEYTPLVEPISLDEAFLDLTDSEVIFGPAEQIAKKIVSRIETEIGLSASAAVAPNKFLAKLGSDLKKPKGFVIINSDNVFGILENLPVSKLWGVGAKTEELLQRMGIMTIGALRKFNQELLHQKLGEVGLQLYRLAHGIDDRPVVNGGSVKSVGNEVTFQNDTDNYDYLAGVLLALADQVARRLRQQNLKGKIITVKLRDSDFKTVTKQTTLKTATDFEEMIYHEALQLADQLQLGQKKLRLIGVSVSGFDSNDNLQLSLFENEEAADDQDLHKLHQVVDQLKQRYGDHIVTKGTIYQIRKRREE